jgi:Fic family protein
MASGRVVLDRDLLKVKDLVCRRERVFADSEHEDISVQIGEINRRLNEAEDKLRIRKSRSATVFRRKKQIAYLVKKHGETSSSEAAKALGISRNRANEYLKDMERSGLLSSKKRGKVVLYCRKQGV